MRDASSLMPGGEAPVISLSELAMPSSDHSDANKPASPHRNSVNRAARVAIVGTGYVGASTAYALLLSGTAAQIVLIEKDKALAEGHAQDLRDAELFSHTAQVTAGDFSDCATADVIIVTAGVGHRPGAPRLEYLKENASIIKAIIQDISQYRPCGVLLMTSNPVDVLTYAACKWSGMDASRILGSGTTLDTSRLRRRLGEHCGMSPNNVHAYVIGEHGDSQVPVLSSARIAGVPLEEFYRALKLPYDKTVLLEISESARAAAAQIISAKGATYYGIAAALVRIVGAILRDEGAVLTVSSLVPDSMELGSVALSLPTIVGREGVRQILPISLNELEHQALRASADILKRNIAFLEEFTSAVV
jgi:L-lactate dehydrogenase